MGSYRDIADAIASDIVSGRLRPGDRLPARLCDRIGSAIRAGAWSAAGLPLTIGVQLIVDGTAERIGKLKRDDAAARQAMARAVLSNLKLTGDPRAYHLWLELPGAWRGRDLHSSSIQARDCDLSGKRLCRRPRPRTERRANCSFSAPRDALLPGLQSSAV